MADVDELTTVGIGDMSGDVFGNGMLLSPHLRIVAAFDHRHIFLDPDPDPAASHAERRRLFELPRSSWADFDRDVISEGGGIHARSLKSVPVTSQVAAALGLEDPPPTMRPDELISIILRAPVDLLWNGGIGTVDASGFSGQLLRVREGGAVAQRIQTDRKAIACMLGGDDGRTLFALTANTTSAEEAPKLRSGRIECTTVEVPGAGWP